MLWDPWKVPITLLWVLTPNSAPASPPRPVGRSRILRDVMRARNANSTFCLLDSPQRDMLLVGILWLKHTRMSRSESKYSGCYECVWLGNDIHLNNVITKGGAGLVGQTAGVRQDKPQDRLQEG